MFWYSWSSLSLSVSPTIRDEMHTWEPMPPRWCVVNQVCSVCLSASHLPLGSTAPCLILCHSSTMAHIHTLNLCRGHTLLHSNHIFLLHQIHFHDSFEQWLSTGELWPKNESQVCSNWITNSRGKMLYTNMDRLGDMPSKIMNKTMQCKRGKNLK